MSRASGPLSGSKALLTPERARDMAQPAWMCDDARARRHVGYAPQIALAMECGRRPSGTGRRVALASARLGRGVHAAASSDPREREPDPDPHQLAQPAHDRRIHAEAGGRPSSPKR